MFSCQCEIRGKYGLALLDVVGGGIEEALGNSGARKASFGELLSELWN